MNNSMYQSPDALRQMADSPGLFSIFLSAIHADGVADQMDDTEGGDADE